MNSFTHSIRCHLNLSILSRFVRQAVDTNDERKGSMRAYLMFNLLIEVLTVHSSQFEISYTNEFCERPIERNIDAKYVIRRGRNKRRRKRVKFSLRPTF